MGILRVENSDHSNWGEIVLDYKQKEYQFPYHIPTHEIFNNDPLNLIRFKCIAITAITPIISVVRSIYWLSLSILGVIAEAYRYLDNQSLSPEIRAAIFEHAHDSVRALSYGASLTVCACIGIFFPFWGRLHYGHLERELNRHPDGPHRDKFYFAICFQRIEILCEDEDQNMLQISERLTNYLERVDAIREAIWACSFNQLMEILHD